MRNRPKKVESEYEAIQRKAGATKELCDRCGNDCSHGEYFIHLPFIKKYIRLCGICQYGLMYGFYLDIKRELLK